MEGSLNLECLKASVDCRLRPGSVGGRKFSYSGSSSLNLENNLNFLWKISRSSLSLPGLFSSAVGQNFRPFCRTFILVCVRVTSLRLTTKFSSMLSQTKIKMQ